MIILGVVFINVIAAQGLTNTTPVQVVGESLSIASLRPQGGFGVNGTGNVTLANLGLKDAGGWVTGSVNISNATGVAKWLNANYTVDYVNQRISFVNSTYYSLGGGSVNNLTTVDYQYYPNSYITMQFGRDSVNMIGGFFALSLVALGVGLFLSIAKDNGIV